MAERDLPTGRVQRLARIGRTAAGAAVKQAGTRTANVARSDERSAEALERRQIETAKQIVKVLGGMKGAAMKLGQVLSFLDVGLVPEEYREDFQDELAKLRDSAPTVSFERMRKVIEEEFGPLDAAFADFEPEPIAAASIGQVYRARLHDGREVAVKVQYPGVADAVRADMQNLGILLRLVRRITPQLDVKALARRFASGSSTSSTTSSRPRTSARWPASTAATRSSSSPPSSPRCLPRAGDRHRVRRGRGFRGPEAPSRRTSATGSARSSSASTSGRCTATAASRATRTPGT